MGIQVQWWLAPLLALLAGICLTLYASDPDGDYGCVLPLLIFMATVALAVSLLAMHFL